MLAVAKKLDKFKFSTVSSTKEKKLHYSKRSNISN